MNLTQSTPSSPNYHKMSKKHYKLLLCSAAFLCSHAKAAQENSASQKQAQQIPSLKAQMLARVSQFQGGQGNSSSRANKLPPLQNKPRKRIATIEEIKNKSAYDFASKWVEEKLKQSAKKESERIQELGSMLQNFGNEIQQIQQENQQAFELSKQVENGLSSLNKGSTQNLEELSSLRQASTQNVEELRSLRQTFKQNNEHVQQAHHRLDNLLQGSTQNLEELRQINANNKKVIQEHHEFMRKEKEAKRKRQAARRESSIALRSPLISSSNSENGAHTQLTVSRYNRQTTPCWNSYTLRYILIACIGGTFGTFCYKTLWFFIKKRR